MATKLVEIKNVCKSFDGVEVLHDFNLYIRENEFVTLLGPSGCGKTTLLRMIGGFDTPDSGEILFEGKVINDLEPNKREINTVFQKYALFPHLNVFDNVAFGLKIKKYPKDQIEKLVKDALRMVGLEGYDTRNIKTLSGGQQQRIAMARAIVNKPKLLLLDEPLAALDLKLRQNMQYELKQMQKDLGITFIYVTHDQEEALTMSDTIVVMNEGRILQIGTPEDIYNEPRTRFVANFIGESNIFEGTMIKDYLVEFEGKKFECVDYGFDDNEPVEVVIRPEDLEIVPKSEGKIIGVVDSITFKGVHYEINVIVDGVEYTIHTTRKAEVGDTLYLNVLPSNIQIMSKPKINTFKGVIRESNKVMIGDIELECNYELDGEEEKEVKVKVYAAHVLLDDIDESDFVGTIVNIKKVGIDFYIYIKADDKIFIASTTKTHEIGEEVGCWVVPEKVMIIDEDN